MRRSMILTIMFAGWALFATLPAAAQTRVFVSCPNGVPCDTLLAGHIDAVGTATLPWIVTFPVPANVCVYTYGGSSDALLKLTIIAPNGTVYRGTDRIVVNPTSAGWYTLQVDSVPPAREQIFQMPFNLLAASHLSCTTTIGR